MLHTVLVQPYNTAIIVKPGGSLLCYCTICYAYACFTAFIFRKGQILGRRRHRRRRRTYVVGSNILYFVVGGQTMHFHLSCIVLRLHTRALLLRARLATFKSNLVLKPCCQQKLPTSILEER